LNKAEAASAGLNGSARPEEQVLAARITPPIFGFRPVATRALATLLQAQALPKLVNVCAAPGYGKTVLLSRLCEELTQRGRTCLWITLDDRDSDLSTLLYLIRAAMSHHGLLEPIDEAALPRFAVPEASTDELLAQLGRVPEGTVLFVDNLGYCHAPELPLLLDRLVFGTGRGLHLVLSSTQEIPVDTVRAKLELGAIELGTAQLSFDRLSTGHLLGEAGLPRPNDETLDRIQAQTEGWPTAVRLLQVLMSNEGQGADANPDEAIGQALDRFSGDHQDIARWLTRRVLVGFDPKLVRFMVELALLREFSGELAAHMTGSTQASAWLETLISRNVLIFPLDRNRRWLRFHTLLREFLLAEARDLLPTARRRELLERAARWHADEGNEAVAIGIALDAHAIALSEDLLGRLASVVAGDQGRMVTYIQWVDRLMSIGGTLTVDTHGWYVWALCNSLQYERARNALDRLDARVKEGSPGSVRATTPATRSATPSRPASPVSPPSTSATSPKRATAWRWPRR
jgi:LuxR family transcriptional regulator, maltose regulon positive regulatory protein